MAHLHISDTVDEVLSNLAEYFIGLANTAIAEKDSFVVSLSGGSSPRKLYSLLVSDEYKEKIDWSRVFFFFGDERYVPETSPSSNFQMAKKVLFEPLNIQPDHYFAVNTSLSPQDAAADYTKTINEFFKDAEPVFDLILLGLGDNSHTASLFPFTPVLHETAAITKEVYLDDQQVYRITFTAPLINMARVVAFLVYGESKAIAINNILHEAYEPDNFPAQLIRPASGELHWFIDRPAASKIKKKE